jgi:glucose-6-phosphate 1-dehydrogenase
MPSEAPVIVIFGITGDLSKRYLLPSLYHLMSQDILPADTKIIGTSRRPLTTEDLLSTVELCVLEADKVCDPEGLKKVEKALSTYQLDPSAEEEFEKFKTKLDGMDKGGKRPRLFYMSVPAEAYSQIVKMLGRSGLNDNRSRLMLEKPFGYDLNSAEKLIKLVGKVFNEDQIYRIDHYLAKEGSQNLLAFRFNNALFEKLWNGDNIRRIEVRATESIGIEGRTNFYEQTGALKDFAQNHLMQLMAITMMDLPAKLDSQHIHKAKQAFLEQMLPADPAKTVRGQYKGYRREVGNPESKVETYVRLSLEHDSERWRGTDIILETGKALARKNAEIVVDFKPEGHTDNKLVFHIQPEEGISLGVGVKELGFKDRTEKASLDFSYANESRQPVEAYERVLMDAVRGDQSLFASDQEVLESWRIVQPLIDAWGESSEPPQLYDIGSGGPAT